MMIWTHPLDELPRGELTWACSCPEHNTDSPECWCDPEIEELENGNLIVIHRDKSEAN